jgi:hypothetical protein
MIMTLYSLYSDCDIFCCDFLIFFFMRDTGMNKQMYVVYDNCCHFEDIIS